MSFDVRVWVATQTKVARGTLSPAAGARPGSTQYTDADGQAIGWFTRRAHEPPRRAPGTDRGRCSHSRRQDETISRSCSVQASISTGRQFLRLGCVI
jgi:hypothetical protein